MKTGEMQNKTSPRFTQLFKNVGDFMSLQSRLNEAGQKMDMSHQMASANNPQNMLPKVMKNKMKDGGAYKAVHGR